MACPCRLQTQAEIMMPHADFDVMVRREEEEAKAHAQGGNVDAEPDKEDNDEDLIEVDEDAMEISIEESVHNNVVLMYQRVFWLSPGAAAALHDDQGIMTIDQLCELTDSLIDKTCRAIQKLGGNKKGYLIPIFARQ